MLSCPCLCSELDPDHHSSHDQTHEDIEVVHAYELARKKRELDEARKLRAEAERTPRQILENKLDSYGLCAHACVPMEAPH